MNISVSLVPTFINYLRKKPIDVLEGEREITVNAQFNVNRPKHRDEVMKMHIIYDKIICPQENYVTNIFLKFNLISKRKRCLIFPIHLALKFPF